MHVWAHVWVCACVLHIARASLGLSVCEFGGIENRAGGVVILLKGVDLLDGTPVVDIKPYLPSVWLLA